MEAEKCNFRTTPHAESQLRMRANILGIRRNISTCCMRYLLGMRSASSACRGTFSACREPAPHAEVPSQHQFHMRRCVRRHLRMRRYLLGVRRASSACKGTFSACGDALPHVPLDVWRPLSNNTAGSWCA